MPMRKMSYFYKLIWIAWLIVKNQQNIFKRSQKRSNTHRETIPENSDSEKDFGSSEIITTTWALTAIHPQVDKREVYKQEKGAKPHFYTPHWKDHVQLLDLPFRKNMEINTRTKQKGGPLQCSRHWKMRPYGSVYAFMWKDVEEIW